LENFNVDLQPDDSDADDKSDGETKELVLRVEEIVAMILKYANKLVDKQFGLLVKQCVITVPASWNLNQRR
jgi:molecular chaperone DnaK (HSP70)